MLKTISDFTSPKWKLLIGRPNLKLKGLKCKNPTCSKNDLFRKVAEDHYICKCGFEKKGKFEIEQKIMPKLYCGTSPCITGKTKMDVQCLKCQFIREK